MSANIGNIQEIIRQYNEKYNNKSMMVTGKPIFDFAIQGSNIYIERYYDHEYRKEVIIPEFVYGFLERENVAGDKTGAFYECKYLQKIIGTSKLHGSMASLFYKMDSDMLILENFDTTEVTDMFYMFHKCGEKNMRILDLGDKFDTSNVINMEGLFRECGCKQLRNINLGNSFKTKNVRAMSNMFSMCGTEKLVELDLGTEFDTGNVIVMDWMFEECGYERMGHLNLGDKFSTVNVKDMRGMFDGCGKIKMKQLNLGNLFITDSVNNMVDMFYGIEDKLIYRNGSIVNTDKFVKTLGKEQ